MQTAVDCNGSNSSNNNTTTTTTTIMESSNSGSIGGCNGGAGELLSHEQSTTAPPSRSTPAVLLTPVAMLEQTNVLRHRLQVGVGVGHSIGTSVMNYGCPATVGVSHKISSTPTHLIDMAEYLGSNIERMSVTPSPSPQASPSKKVLHRNAETSPTLTQPPPPPPLKSASNAELILVPSQSNNSSSTSSSNSSSNSSTSSVIATPVSIKRELARRRAQYGEANVDDVGGVDGVLGATEDILALNGRDCAERRDILANRGLPLNTANNEERLSVITPTTPLTPLTPTLTSPSPSLSSSSSSVAPSTKSASHKSSTESSSLISSTAVTPTKNSSKLNSLTTTKLPAFNSPAQLQHFYEMPKYLQFNPYVLNGYRPLTTFRGCLLSLFYWHNETVNILTHAIPIFYILAIVPGLMPWEQEYRFLSFCHLFGSVAPWCGSFVYHLFMNIERGEHVYYTLLKLDMVGIWVSQSFGALPLVTATTFCFSPVWKWFIIISYCLLSLWGLYKALTASSPWQRRLCFALPFTMRSILTFFRTLDVWVGGSRIALSHVYLQDGVSILGGVIGAMRIPEKWMPGVVDFYLNSHNIMHVLVVVAVYSMHKATIKDFEWMSATDCNASDGNSTGIAIDTTFTSNVEL